MMVVVVVTAVYNGNIATKSLFHGKYMVVVERE